MHTLAHGFLATPSLCLFMIFSNSRMLLLRTRILAAIQDTQICTITLDESLRSRVNIRNQPIQKIETHALSNHQSQNLNVILSGRERVIRDDVLFGAQQVRDGDLFEMRKLFLELIAEAECYNGETGVIVC